MTRTRYYNTEAVVLRKSALGEADSIITLYTPKRGKLRAVAKGVRRPKSKLGGHIELLTYSQVSLSLSRNLDIITQSQTIDGFFALREDLLRTSQALYVAEITWQSTVEEEPNYPLFKLLVETLRCLCLAKNCETALRRFELHLAHCLGYRPQLFECLNCRNPLQPDDRFYFTPTGGGVLCHYCRNQESIVYPLSIAALKTLRFLQRCDYENADRLKINPDLSAEIKRLMQGYTTCLLERKLKSGEWVDRLKREGF